MQSIFLSTVLIAVSIAQGVLSLPIDLSAIPWLHHYEQPSTSSGTGKGMAPPQLPHSPLPRIIMHHGTHTTSGQQGQNSPSTGLHGYGMDPPTIPLPKIPEINNNPDHFPIIGHLPVIVKPKPPAVPKKPPKTNTHSPGKQPPRRPTFKPKPSSAGSGKTPPRKSSRPAKGAGQVITHKPKSRNPPAKNPSAGKPSAGKPSSSNHPAVKSNGGGKSSRNPLKSTTGKSKGNSSGTKAAGGRKSSSGHHSSSHGTSIVKGVKGGLKGGAFAGGSGAGGAGVGGAGGNTDGLTGVKGIGKGRKPSQPKPGQSKTSKPSHSHTSGHVPPKTAPNTHSSRPKTVPKPGNKSPKIFTPGQTNPRRPTIRNNPKTGRPTKGSRPGPGGHVTRHTTKQGSTPRNPQTQGSSNRPSSTRSSGRKGRGEKIKGNHIGKTVKGLKEIAKGGIGRAGLGAGIGGGALGGTHHQKKDQTKIPTTKKPGSTQHRSGKQPAKPKQEPPLPIPNHKSSLSDPNRKLMPNSNHKPSNPKHSTKKPRERLTKKPTQHTVGKPSPRIVSKHYATRAAPRRAAAPKIASKPATKKGRRSLEFED